MLPIYLSYFAGGGEHSTRKTLTGALGFVTGFTVVFVLMGALAGTVGGFLQQYQTAVNVVSGLIVIFFGLNFLGIIKLTLFKGTNHAVRADNMNFFSALVFGVIFSVGWTPCVGAFLGLRWRWLPSRGMRCRECCCSLSIRWAWACPL